jgi:hypothetical protein
MKPVIFLGPSLDLGTARAMIDAEFRPPVRMGDVYRAARAQPESIGIIDGFFEQTPAVWHKEILYALSEGIPVYGAASMGALRAAELHPFGMRGVGAIFAQFASGVLEDDDEVAVVHAPEDLGHAAQSEAMVNLRHGLALAAQAGLVDEAEKAMLLAHAKALFYPERSWARVHSAARAFGMPHDRVARLEAFITERRPDQKREDAIALLREIAKGRHEPAPTFAFERTKYWERVETYFAHAGDGRADDPTFERVRNHARLAPADREHLRNRALLLLLVDGEAIRMGIEVDIRDAFMRFRRKRGLLSPQQLAEWMERNRISREECLDIARLDFTLEQIAARRVAQVDWYLACALKMDGRYGDMIGAVREKWRGAKARSFGLLGADDESTVARALDWYRHEYGSLSGTVAEHAADLGFDSERQFLDELCAEFAARKGAVTETLS